MEGAEGKHPGIPTDWSEDARGLHCLACRRVLAGEAAAMGEQAAEARGVAAVAEAFLTPAELPHYRKPGGDR